MLKFIRHFSRSYSVILLILFLALAGLNLYQKDYREFVNNMMFALFNFMLAQGTMELAFYVDFLKMKFEVCARQMDCIVALANLAAPAVGYDKVIAILEKHNIDIKKIWNDFDDKHNRRLRRKLDLPVPEWVSDLKEKVKQEVSQPQALYENRTQKEYK